MALLEGDDIRTWEQFQEAQRPMSYGAIPYEVRSAHPPVSVYGRISDLANCPNCGAPIQSSLCAYCKTRFQAVHLPDPDDICPQCGELVDSDDLIGDSMVVTLMYCRRCGWQGSKQWRSTH